MRCFHTHLTGMQIHIAANKFSIKFQDFFKTNPLHNNSTSKVYPKQMIRNVEVMCEFMAHMCIYLFLALTVYKAKQRSNHP